jgi:phasin family protein
MNKTRFRLPPRTGAPVGVDHWVTGESVMADFRPADTKMAPAVDRSTEIPTPLKSPFLFDLAALFTAQWRNIAAITAANRIVVETAQSVVRRNVEILYQAIDGVPERVQAMADPECPRDRAMRQTETVIKAYEDASANMRQIGAMIQHANTEAMELLTRRFTEAADEVKSLARYVARSF